MTTTRSRSDTSPDAELPSHYFELYELAVEMADRVSARRGVANSFFLTINTGIVALLANQSPRWYLAAAGIVFSISWWALLRSYRELNRAKFKIIVEMEKRLPVSLYGDEWAWLDGERESPEHERSARKSRLNRYRELGSIERLVPWAFAAIYLVELGRQLLG